MLGIGPTKAYELIGRGEFQVVHIDGAARVPLLAVHRYVDRLVSPPRRTIRSAPRQGSASQPPLPFIDLPKDCRMASISKRYTASGEARYDVRYRPGGRAVEETFKRRQDAENRVRQVEAEKLRGQVVDPRRGREKLADFAERWLDAPTVKGKLLAPMTRQGYRGLLWRNIEPTIGQYALAEITPSVVRDWYSKSRSTPAVIRRPRATGCYERSSTPPLTTS